MNLYDRLFKPVMTVQTVNAIATAAGTSFSELLDKALKAGQVDQAQAARLRTKAAENEADAKTELQATIAAANAKFDAEMAKVEETKLAASHKEESSAEVLGAVNAAKQALGK